MTSIWIKWFTGLTWKLIKWIWGNGNGTWMERKDHTADWSIEKVPSGTHGLSGWDGKSTQIDPLNPGETDPHDSGTNWPPKVW